MPPAARCGACIVRGRFSEAEQDYEEAIAALRAQGDALAAADATVSLALAHGFWGKIAQSRKLMEGVVEMLEREPPGPELARAYSQIARSMWLTGFARESLEWSAKALRLGEELGIHGVAVIALQMRGGARCELGDMGGLKDLTQALQMSLEYGLGNETVRGHMNPARPGRHPMEVVGRPLRADQDDSGRASIAVHDPERQAGQGVVPGFGVAKVQPLDDHLRPQRLTPEHIRRSGRRAVWGSQPEAVARRAVTPTRPRVQVQASAPSQTQPQPLA